MKDDLFLGSSEALPVRPLADDVLGRNVFAAVGGRGIKCFSKRRIVEIPFLNSKVGAEYFLGGDLPVIPKIFSNDSFILFYCVFDRVGFGGHYTPNSTLSIKNNSIIDN